nr:DMT family transporter [Microlunatus panaciterrae]
MAALASAAVFAGSTALQHRAAARTPGDDRSGLRIFGPLVRRPSWLVGIAMSFLAFCLHALALKLGPLGLVQPIIVSSIVFAVFIRAGLDRRLPPRKVLVSSAITWGGLALFIATTHASAPKPPRDSVAAWFVGLAVAVVAVTVVSLGKVATPERRGLLLGASAGILFGLVAGLIKLVISQLHSGVGAMLTHWPVWAMIIVGVAAFVLNQQAYQATRLSVSMPVLNIFDVMVAIGFGVAVFGEQPFSSPVTLVAEVVGLVAMAVGVRQLAHHEESSKPQEKARTDAPGTAHV